jgi:hypothetical protein
MVEYLIWRITKTFYLCQTKPTRKVVEFEERKWLFFVLQGCGWGGGGKENDVSLGSPGRNRVGDTA